MGIVPSNLFLLPGFYRSSQAVKAFDGRSVLASVRKRQSFRLCLEELEQRHLLSAVPSGSEFQVNSFTTGPQQTFFQSPHAVGVNPSSGDYVVTWSSQDQTPGSGWDVYAQRYNALGIPVGGEFRVNTTTADDQQYSTVAMDASGNFVVTWSGHQAGHWDVYAQRYNSSGTAQGSEFQVNTTTTSDQMFSTVAMDASGNFVVTWSGHQSGNWDVYAQRYSASGVAQGGEFQVDTPAASDQEFSNVTMTPAGSFVVTWSGHQSGNWDIYAQRYDASGVAQGGEFQVNTTTANDQEFSTVASDITGNFVVTWSGHQSGNWDIYAQRYDSLGVAQGSEFQVNTTTANDQEFSTVAMNATGNFVVTWSSHNQDGSGWGIYGQQYSSAGVPQAGEFRINTYTQDDQEWSSVAMDSSGNFVVAWTSNGQDGSNLGVFAQRYTVPILLDLPLLGGAAPAISATEGISFTGALATFTDLDLLATANDFSATITWGDGQTSGGNITATGLGGFTVSGTNTYAEEGAYATTILIQDLGGASATINGSATVSDAPLSATGVAVTATEGCPFTGVVASFTDPSPVTAATSYSATITWGDGNTSAGAVTANGSGGFNVSGSNTYGQEGSYTVGVTIQDVGGSTASAGSTASVADAPLTGAAAAINVTEGASFTGVVATFSDGDPAGTLGSYTATITWGDGNTSPGTITANASGGFNVTGTNTYVQEGSYSVGVTIRDAGGSTAGVAGTASVADAPLSAAGAPVTATEGASFTGVVATFSDSDPAATASAFTATITWGDGNSSAGTIMANSGGGFSVSGTNTYAEEGGYAVAVTINDAGGSTVTSAGTASVADAPLGATGVTVQGVEGTRFSAVVATFADADLAGTAGDYTATITWGDGHTSTGIVAASGSSFSVRGTHVYNGEGSYAVAVAITDVGGSSIGTTSTAIISEAPLSTTPAVITATEAGTFSGVVATFLDPDASSTAASFSVNINWGDGHASVGTVTATSPNGAFTVTGTNTYAEEGGYTVVVTIVDAGDPSPTVINSAATVLDAALSGTGLNIAATEGAGFTGVVAIFRDGDAAGTTNDYTATINWGDGNSSAGTITANPNGSFSVTGNNDYLQEGSYGVSVTITDAGGSTVTASGAATVADAALAAAGVAVTPIEGASFTGVVATFSDSDPAGMASTYTATITWGDGQTSTGSITANSGGGFSVTGTNTYAQEGRYTIGVTIQDAGGSTAGAASAANVADAALSATGVNVSPTEGLSFTGVVAFFHDGDPAGTVNSYTATVTWGDGSTSSGTITANSSGGFSVWGTNMYAQEGSYAIGVTIRDAGGSTVAAASTANVADAALSAAGQSIAVVQGVSFTGVVATFRDADPAGSVGSYRASIAWGDGNTSPGTITANPNGSFNVAGTHTYVQAGTYAVRVTIEDAGGSIVTAAGSASVADAPLRATGVPVTATEGIAFTGVTATFRDADPAATAGSFTAIIAWGDGTSSPGTIAANSSGFSVSGTKAYAQEGRYPVRVTIQDSGGATVSATSAASVVDAALSAKAVQFTGFAVTPSTGVVATFDDADPASSASTFTATIIWGDGHSSAGTITANGAGGFNVTGTNTYARPGRYAVRITIRDVDGSTVKVTSSAAVGDATLAGSGVDINATEGTSFTGIVARFSDPAPLSTTSSFTATILWGDGTTSRGIVTANTGGGFSVTGTNTYARHGSYALGVTIQKTNGISISTTSLASVADARLSAAGVPVTTVAGARFTGVVATFSDADPASTSSFFKATILWGDGNVSPGIVTANTGGGFSVTGTNTYVQEGDYAVKVLIQDAGGSRTSATATATITQPLISVSGTEITATQESPFTGTVATFSDADTSGTASDYTATITWGDGHASVGTITANGNGRFSVSGTNTYQAPGAYAVAVTIKGSRGRSATAQNVATVAAASQPPPSLGGTPASESAGTGSTTNLALGFANPTFVSPGLPTSGFGGDTASSLPGTTGSGLPQGSSGGGGQGEPSDPGSSKSSPANKALAPVTKPAPGTTKTPPSTQAGPKDTLPPATPGRDAVAKGAQSGSVESGAAQHDWAGLDALKQDTQAQSAPQVVDALFITGAVASAGYILLTGRSLFWLLSALTARPLWKQLDPQEILLDWEKEKEKIQGRKADGEEETLRSLVQRESSSTR
jgi:hypothetical protein